MPSKQKIKEAIEAYGSQVVSEVRAVAELGDPDGAYSMFEDMGMYDHSECVQMLYFED